METFFPPIDSVPNTAPLATPNPALNTSANPNASQKINPTPTPDPMIIMDSNPVEPVEIKSPKKENDDDAPPKTKKKPTRQSDVWDHFTKIPGENPNDLRCNCNYCGANYACHSTRVGTSSLWVHLKKCKKYPKNMADKKQKVLSFKCGIDGEGSLLVATFNKVRCRNALAKFVVKDEQAFNVVEGAGFKDLINELQPRFVVPSRMTITRDIYTLFCNERSKLKKELTVAGQKVCLTTDCWTSRTQMSYMCLTAHYIDSDWKLQKRIINFCQVSNHKGEQQQMGTTERVAGKETRKRRLLENYMQQQQMGTTEKKNDIDIYLAEEPLDPMTDKFDILLWWKDNSSRYTTLSLIAKDILVIPVSTVASESAFSTSGRILDPFRSSLSPKMVEALICTQNWLKGSHGGIKANTYLDETHSYEFLEVEEGNMGKKDTAASNGKARNKTINLTDD